MTRSEQLSGQQTFHWHGEKIFASCIVLVSKTKIFSTSSQAKCWHLTGRHVAHRGSSAWRAFPKQQRLAPGLHLACTPKQLVGQHAAVLSSTALSGTVLAMEEPLTQHSITANNVVAPETLYYEASYDQPINHSLSYMKSLTIRCVQDQAGQLHWHQS